MERLKDALEKLDEVIFDLEHKIGLDKTSRRETAKQQNEIVRQIRARDAHVMSSAQKVAARLDQTIAHVEHILRH